MSEQRKPDRGHVERRRDEWRAAGEDDESTEPNQAQRSTQQAIWVDMKIRQAMRQGEFDNLPGTGKPIKGLGETHDPDWWAKNLVEREKITGLGPPAILLRKEDAELDDRLDRENTEAGVRTDRRRLQRPGRRGPPPAPRRPAGHHRHARRRRAGRRCGASGVSDRRALQRAQLAAAQPTPTAGRTARRRWWRRRP